MAIAVAQPPEEFQVKDIDYLLQLNNNANWSEMGAKKTSTGLWMIEKKAREKGIENPKVLIVTTRSGKGTFFQLAPMLLPKWQLYDADLRGVSTFIAGQRIPLKLEALGDNFTMPIIVLSHYHVFLKANKGIPVTYDEDDPSGDPDKMKGYPKVDSEGHIIFKPLTQADYLMEIKWDFVWVDEAHRIKERKNRWVKNLKKTNKTADRHASTGTGFINRPQEIWSIMNFLEPKEVNYVFDGEKKTLRMNNYWAFVDEFCLEEISETGYRKVVGIKPDKKDEFRALVRHFGPRHDLDEVMPHLKQPIPVRRDVDLSPTQRKMYNQIISDLEVLDQKGETFSVPTVLAMLSRLRQVCVATPQVVSQYFDPRTQKFVQEIELVEPSSKLDAFMEVLDELSWDEEKKQQIVVFSCFKDPLRLLEKRLEEANVPYLHLKTEDNDETRYNKWSVEWPKKEHQVFLSTVSLGGESINLTSAQHICFLDRSWSPKDTAQAIGRVRRPGQEGQPVVINIEAVDTTDQYVESVVQGKENWFRMIFGRESK